MRSDTRADYDERMLRVLLHIQEHLDDALPLDGLAAVAHFSPYHFHRIFRGMMGESVRAHVRRLRLERAAHRLKHTDQPVARLALEAGYEAHEAFTRAFRAMFEESPSGFRQTRNAATYTRAPSGVHYVADGRLSDFDSTTRGDRKLEATVTRVDPILVVFVRHIGPYELVGEAWNKLCAWAAARGLLGASTQAIGVAYDDPDVTPPQWIRCDACVVVDRPIKPEGEVALQSIGGGDYAVTRHVGPYAGLADTYTKLCGHWLPQSGREVRSAAALEVYRNSPVNTPPDELITDIHLPLEATE